MGFLSALNLGGNSYKLKPGNFYECRSMEQWNALTQEQQDEYDYVLITGDEEEQDLTNAYLTTDSAVSTINVNDYFPVQKTDGTKKKLLWNTIINKIKATLGTAAQKDSTDEVTENSTDLVESGAVYSEVNTVNQTLTNQANDMVNVLGAKNLCPNNATSQTINGVTYTVNSDGRVRAQGAVSSGSNYARLILSTDMPIKSGRYKLTGCPQGLNGGYLRFFPSGGGTYYQDFGNGLEFDIISDGVYIWDIVIVPSDGNVDVTFEPMLRPASVADDTYVPYAMTNRELTKVAGLSSSGSVTLSERTSTGYGSITCDYTKQGSITQILITIPAKAITLNIYDAIKWQLPSELIPKSVGVQNVVVDVDGHKFVERIQTSGTLDLQTFQALTSIQAIVISETYFTR